MAARRGDFERAACMRLATHVGHVGDGGGKRRRCHGVGQGFPAFELRADGGEGLEIAMAVTSETSC